MPDVSPGRSLDSPRSSLSRAGATIGGRYRLVAPIGAGAMGEVWRAEHATLGTAVAVKLVDTAGRADKGEILARFQQEARAAAQLRSPHVVQILDHGIDGALAFIAMELLEGESLERRLARRSALTPGEVARVVREMARGIERAHAAGIIHRDLKPPNVFLARAEGAEIVKVLDFGIAKVLGAPHDAHLQTQQGFVVGTPAYMSPEQVLGKPLDARSDLWQVGVIAFECLTGKRPFDGGALGHIFMRICSGPLPVPSSIGAVPAGFDAWFARALQRDPARRFASAGELADALAAILAPDGEPIPALDPRVNAPDPVPAGTGKVAWTTSSLAIARSRKPLVLAAIFVPLMLVVAAGFAWDHLQAPAEGATTAAPSATARVEPPTRLEPPAPVATVTASSPASAAPAAKPAIIVKRPAVQAPPASTGDRLGI